MGNNRKCYYCPTVADFSQMNYIDAISDYVCKECMKKQINLIQNPHIHTKPIFCKCGHLKFDHLQPEDVDIKDLTEAEPEVDEADLCLPGQCGKCDCYKFRDMSSLELSTEVEDAIEKEICPRCNNKLKEFEDGSSKDDLDYNSYYCEKCDIWINGWIKKYGQGKYSTLEETDWRPFFIS